MTLRKFAEEYRLKIRLDECGDPIIPGRKGHLYWDAGGLCAMWLDAPPVNKSRMAQLGGEVWQGDISPNAQGRRVQDAKVTGIDSGQYRLAIRLAGVKAKRIMSPAQREVLAKAQANSPLLKERGGDRAPERPQAVESPGEGGED